MIMITVKMGWRVWLGQWEYKHKIIIPDDHIFFNLRGELVGVAGAVGSGKTSLVSAIMGEVSQPL